MTPDTLIVSEVFYSIQGEGQTMGVPAVFLRLGGCNLLCESEHWRCDTIEVWKKGRATKFENVLSDDMIGFLKGGAHLVITGGEPLMQQEQVSLFLMWLKGQRKIAPIVEIETNGTIEPNPFISIRAKYWNVSPKLANSGMPYSKRVNDVAIKRLQEVGATFKFVVNRLEDVLHILDDYDFIDSKNIILMPAGDSIDQLAITGPLVAELCKQFGYRYSHRLHISLWNKKTGV